ncbi:MAG TPA: HAD-IIA family hydrolase [Actinomycetota bacterium]|nr:HAD-IIA family hydrolase [Actinomycetota bacterium]
MAIDGVLIDMDGVLATSWRPLPGAADTIERLRSDGVPFLVVSNTTTHTRAAFAKTLSETGLPLEPDEIVTAVVGTASYLRRHHPQARVFLLSDGDPREDLDGVRLVDGPPADVVVLGGASDEFTYAAIDDVFRMLMDGAALVGMHRNLYWRTDEGLQLDGGAYIVGLEAATGRPATICGKPSPDFFAEAVAMLGTDPSRTAMAGDDVANDVLGAQAAGLIGVLVRTGKFSPGDLERVDGRPDHQIGSIADLPDLLASS